MRRMRPRTGDEDGSELEEGAGATGSSRMQTAASEVEAPMRRQLRGPSKEEGERKFPGVVPFEAPEPRKMAGRPVD